MKWNAVSDHPCNLCPRNCMADRGRGSGGFCRSGRKITVARAALHMWEEPCISGKRGSGTIFFSGCNLQCVYCQNAEIASGNTGKEISEERLVEIILNLQEEGAANINLVTPDHYVIPIAKAVAAAKDEGLKIPVVFNGSGYEKKEIVRELAGIVDIYLTDFKYMDAALARKYSHAEDYPEVAKEALEEMVKTVGKAVFDKDGMMLGGVIVRHLLLPGHKQNAKDVIRYVYETYGDLVYLSLMNQYTPFERLKAEPDWKELCRKVTQREYDHIVDYALSLGVQNAFIQEGETAKDSFIPPFDLRGL